jgi:hypothetical protein
VASDIAKQQDQCLIMNEPVVVDRAIEWRRLKGLVVDSVSSPITRRVYNLGLDEFIAWFQQEPRAAGFTKATIVGWRVALEVLAPSLWPNLTWVSGMKAVVSEPLRLALVTVRAIQRTCAKLCDKLTHRPSAVSGSRRPESI